MLFISLVTFPSPLSLHLFSLLLLIHTVCSFCWVATGTKAWTIHPEMDGDGFTLADLCVLDGTTLYVVVSRSVAVGGVGGGGIEAQTEDRFPEYARFVGP